MEDSIPQEDAQEPDKPLIATAETMPEMSLREAHDRRLIGTTTYLALVAAGYLSVKDVARQAEETLLAIPTFRPRELRDLKAALATLSRNG